MLDLLPAAAPVATLPARGRDSFRPRAPRAQRETLLLSPSGQGRATVEKPVVCHGVSLRETWAISYQLITAVRSITRNSKFITQRQLLAGLLSSLRWGLGGLSIARRRRLPDVRASPGHPGFVACLRGISKKLCWPRVVCQVYTSKWPAAETPSGKAVSVWVVGLPVCSLQGVLLAVSPGKVSRSSKPNVIPAFTETRAHGL